jgi:hypothetical protein
MLKIIDVKEISIFSLKKVKEEKLKIIYCACELKGCGGCGWRSEHQVYHTPFQKVDPNIPLRKV